MWFVDDDNKRTKEIGDGMLIISLEVRFVAL